MNLAHSGQRKNECSLKYLVKQAPRLQPCCLPKKWLCSKIFSTSLLCCSQKNGQAKKMFLKKFFDPQASDIRAVHLLRVIHEGVSLKLFPTVLESVQPATCYCTRGEIRSKLLHTCLCSSIAFAHWTNWWSFHLRYETTKKHQLPREHRLCSTAKGRGKW